ncbi:16991_t:CDS:2 [Funneliformis caledonium]|uniref:16991_t:CDS:1 n=1 Tax=Funneliformis caledonium TaxID=1117310 RepID=A0A9N9A2N9_9GLOM|nr:16991_t:CDS:2 [Funneliformis caledonium]
MIMLILIVQVIYYLSQLTKVINEVTDNLVLILGYRLDNLVLDDPFKDYYNLDTEKNNHTELYSANNNDQICSHGVSNQVTSEHVSDMCKEMKVMFIQSQNPGSAAVAAVGKNNENIKFLKGCRLEYLAQYRSQFNNDLNFYVKEYVKINNISSIPSEDDTASFVNNTFLKNIFFTQLAVIEEDELFNNITIINTLKILLKKAFILHLILEVLRLTNYNVDNYHTLQQVKELDH